MLLPSTSKLKMSIIILTMLCLLCVNLYRKNHVHILYIFVIIEKNKFRSKCCYFKIGSRHATYTVPNSKYKIYIIPI